MSFLGNLYIISSPSGAGKSTLLRKLFTELSDSHPMRFSISHTTRAMRPGETNGVEYHFVSTDEFKNMIAQDAFLEWAQVFDNFYGTSRQEVEKSLQKGIDVFLDIDWQGARIIRERFPEVKTIFILPPSLEILEERLIKRGQDQPDVIANRMKKARNEISHHNEYDYIIVNDKLEEAYEQLRSIVIAEQTKKSNQLIKLHDLLQKLLQE